MRIPESWEKHRITDGACASARGDPRGGFFAVLAAPDRTMYAQVVIAINALGWDHASMTMRSRTSPNVYRVPTWDEMCWLKDQLCGPDEIAVQFHPAKKDYVNFHPHVLHLWRPTRETMPIPPKECV